MHLQESLQKLYLILSKDDILTRLLHYVPVNAQDDALDVNKPSIIDMPIKERQAILDQVLLPTDKRYDLDYKRVRISRLCFYTGIRKPIDSNTFGRGNHENPYVAEQNYIFDIYVHVDIDTLVQRVTAIADRLNEILHLNRVNDIGPMRFAYLSPINGTPDGFIGIKFALTTLSAQDKCDFNG